jgi:hypothetical protein
MAQVVVCLPSKHEALYSNPSTTKGAAIEIKKKKAKVNVSVWRK